MKIRLATLIGAAAACMLCVAARPRGAAARRRPAAEPVRVIWVRPNLVPALRRPALAHLLAAAASGEPLRGDCVRDSRPQVDGQWLVTPGRKQGRKQRAPVERLARPPEKEGEGAPVSNERGNGGSFDREGQGSSGQRHASRGTGEQ